MYINFNMLHAPCSMLNAIWHMHIQYHLLILRKYGIPKVVNSIAFD